MIHLPDDLGSRNAVHSITSSARASSVGGTIATVSASEDEFPPLHGRPQGDQDAAV
jgi:hypothetical protein